MPKPEFLDALKHVFDFEPPRAHGFDTVETIRAMRDGRVKVFVAMGGNFAAATPDTQTTLAALETLRLSVHVSTKLNRSHTVVGDISYDKAGEWSKARNVFTQFQNVVPGDMEQFGNGKVEPILWPPEFKTGTMVYPYAAAKKP